MSDIILQALFSPIMLILFLPLAYAIFRLYLQKQQFQKSKYKDASGNSYGKTVSDKGNSGEYLTFLVLEKLSGDKRILTNLYLPKEDGKTTEIDLLMIHKTGLYVFESKNYSGWIFGADKDRYWTQTLPGGKKSKIFNPIWQNAGHVNALRKILDEGTNESIYSYIVFSERCELNKVSVTGPGGVVLKRNRLFDQLQKDINSRPEILSKDAMDELDRNLSEYVLADEAVKTAHIESIAAK